MRIFLAPHCDDETLFGAYTLLRHRPLVVVCFNGRRRDETPDEVREAETVAALKILGCPHEFLRLQCDPPDWDAVKDALARYAPAKVWAPLPEDDGQSHHNHVGELALELWPGTVSLYSTYTMNGGRSRVGRKVEASEGWPGLKRQALACYESQIARPGTRPHFERGLDEYLSDETNPPARST